MKVLALLLVGLFSTSLFAKTVTKRRIDDLERRVTLLEQKVTQLSGSSTDATTGLKVKDGNNQIKRSETDRGVASTPQISDSQKKEILDSLELYKKKKQDSQKLLDELMNEDF